MSKCIHGFSEFNGHVKALLCWKVCVSCVTVAFVFGLSPKGPDVTEPFIIFLSNVRVSFKFLTSLHFIRAYRLSVTPNKILCFQD